MGKDGGIRVFNTTKVPQVYGEYVFPAEAWTYGVPYHMAMMLAARPEFRVDDERLLADYRYWCEDGTYLGWSSPLHYADGYGSVAQEIAQTFLEKLGVSLSIHPRDYDPGHTNFGRIPVERWTEEAFVPESVVERLCGKQVPCFYGINMTWPREVHLSPFPRTIGYTMFETTKPPAWWAESMNKCRRIITPCKQNMEAFRSIGVTVPIDVVNLGIDPDRWAYVDRGRRDYRERPFIFLMAGGITRRKNPMGAVKAFVEAFKDEPGVRLVIKTRGTHTASGFRDWMCELADDSRIVVFCEDSSPERMVGLFHDADAFVFPSRGEGFGLPPLQAMATGLPTIVANNSGMSEYASSKFCWPVPCEEVPVPDVKHGGFPDEWGDCGNWWEPDHKSLVKAFQSVFSNPKSAFAKGRKASEWVRANFSLERTCGEILEVVKRDFAEDGK